MTNTLTTTRTAHDPRPLPVIIAEQWRFPLQCHVIDGVEYYAAQDWMRGVMQKQDVRSDWKHVQQRAGQRLKQIQRLPYTATDGKTYQREFADAHGLYAITQHMRATTGIRAAVLDFLAKAGVRMDEYRRDPEKAVTDALGGEAWGERDDRWKDARLNGIITRKAFTDALRDVVAGVDGAFYAQSTEMVYKGLWERTTAQLRGDLGITPKENPRDHFERYALVYTQLAEGVATEMLRGHDAVTRTMAAEIIDRVTRLIKPQADATRAFLGRDLVTGKPLLGGGQ